MMLRCYTKIDVTKERLAQEKHLQRYFNESTLNWHNIMAISVNQNVYEKHYKIVFWDLYVEKTPNK